MDGFFFNKNNNANGQVTGKTYYKIAGKNLWIPASKLNLR
ncbi:hypothetical protein HMPREF0493_0415 [Lactobacillus amylolyticus DSM 11664]|uniref:Surface layer protein A domain-containing protein n=1 Tax=Lactobacillus amylolyticus DSM 11664 TaxID=585524 RepID=D4YSD7_9LACO|nr:hypothetical protein HMPREF0493_0415 [Lactobacillus amylolyticus DSM 11664]